MKFSAVRRYADGQESPVGLRTECMDGVTEVRPVFEIGSKSDLRPLDPECGVRIRIDPETDIRYMADWRYSEFWCAPFFGTDLTAVPRDTQYFLYRKEDLWGVIVPVTDRDYKCVLEGTPDGLPAKQFSWFAGPSVCEDLAFVWAEGEDPFALTEKPSVLPRTCSKRYFGRTGGIPRFSSTSAGVRGTPCRSAFPKRGC